GLSAPVHWLLAPRWLAGAPPHTGPGHRPSPSRSSFQPSSSSSRHSRPFSPPCLYTSTRISLPPRFVRETAGPSFSVASGDGHRRRPSRGSVILSRLHLVKCTSLRRLYLGAWRFVDTSTLPRGASFPRLQELSSAPPLWRAKTSTSYSLRATSWFASARIISATTSFLIRPMSACIDRSNSEVFALSSKSSCSKRTRTQLKGAEC
ncbi:unnamed protein product, partial [Urochloa humidicola]